MKENVTKYLFDLSDIERISRLPNITKCLIVNSIFNLIHITFGTGYLTLWLSDTSSGYFKLLEHLFIGTFSSPSTPSSSCPARPRGQLIPYQLLASVPAVAGSNWILLIGGFALVEWVWKSIWPGSRVSVCRSLGVLICAGHTRATHQPSVRRRLPGEW